MKKLRNIELDLLLRIDFFELTGYGERLDYSDKQFEADKKEIKNKFGISKTIMRKNEGFEYLRLTEIERDLNPYTSYLKELKLINRFWCCQLEQAIGLFQDGELRIFFSTDSGLCFDTQSHLAAIEESYKIESIEDWSKKGRFDVNTFFGIRNGKNLNIDYTPNSNNIDARSKDNEKYEVELVEFSEKLVSLKKRINFFYKKVKEKVRDLPEGAKDEKIDEVFNENIINN